MATVRARWNVAFGRLSTSKKILAILSLALLPLGIVALLASLQTTRTADAQRRSQLNIAATESARKLSTELASDIFSLRQASDAAVPGADACLKMRPLLDARGGRQRDFTLFDGNGLLVCASGVTAPQTAAAMPRAGRVAVRQQGDGLDLVVAAVGGDALAAMHYPADILDGFARPAGYGLPYRLSLDIGGRPLVIEDRLAAGALARTESVSIPVGLDDLSVSMTTASAPFGATEALLTFLPLVMWASAAVVAFYVSERLLIRPLRSLSTAVANYEAHSPAPLLLAATPAIEIRDLGATFVAFADRLAEREQAIEAVLVDQVRLTREVHHRVKNNLQVIASLISLHARDTLLDNAPAAFASIQRRVDALAIVHRNHFAELEHNQGIDFRTLLSELASNFRVGAGPDRRAITINVRAETACVDQDTAVPLAFLFTELAEVSLFADPSAALTASTRTVDGGGEFELTSSVFADPARYQNSPSLRIATGLARQLRSPLRYDAARSSYAVTFPLLKTKSAPDS